MGSFSPPQRKKQASGRLSDEEAAGGTGNRGLRHLPLRCPSPPPSLKAERPSDPDSPDRYHVDPSAERESATASHDDHCLVEPKEELRSPGTNKLVDEREGSPEQSDCSDEERDSPPKEQREEVVEDEGNIHSDEEDSRWVRKLSFRLICR